MKLDDDIFRVLDTAAAPLTVEEVSARHRTVLERAGIDPEYAGADGVVVEAPAVGGVSRRGRLGVLVVAAAAAVAVLVGVAVIGGDRGSDSDVVLVGAADEDLVPPPGSAQGSEAVDGTQGGNTEPGAGEESAGQEALAPTDARPQVDATVPWPDPVVVAVSPATTSESNIVNLDSSGVVVLRIQGTGFGEGQGYLAVCGSVDFSGGGFSCSDRAATQDAAVASVSRMVDLTEGVDVEVVTSFEPGADAIVVVMPVAAEEPLLVASVTAPTADHGPRLWSGTDENGPGTSLWIDRLEATAFVRGRGWDPARPLVFHVCQTTGDREIDRERCDALGSVAVGADGDVAGEVVVRGAGGEPLVQGLEQGYLVAVQGEHVEWLVAMEMPPLIATDVSAVDPPAVVELTVTGLRRGETAEIRVCAGMQCAPPLSQIAVRGSGSGEDVVEVEVAAEAAAIELFASGLSLGMYELRSPAPPPSSGSATVTVEPATVPAPGEYTFTVTGQGWTASPPVFVLPCVDEDLGSCDTGNLTPVTPDAGAFEVEVTYEVDAGGLVIAAGDAAQSQSARARITVGS